MLGGFEWLLLALAVGRFTRLMVEDEITAPIREQFLTWKEEEEEGETVLYPHPKGTGIQYWIGALLACYWCSSIWAAIFLYFGFVLFPTIFIPIIIILSAAWVAAIIETGLRKW
ncbi:DUF1360 domain-containing protein [Shouchella lonarensis]|uniref:Sporulation protein YjcA n=1 Tax=Shouchella lonarensis TaxID=1464122 RepID=A0A1G6GM90_9BACI|nr:DUF1360 domain-containing protein [Shouchella lonarensis]SDB82953.1 Protein of unknown function [Shouchella lonarensis]